MARLRSESNDRTLMEDQSAVLALVKQEFVDGGNDLLLLQVVPVLEAIIAIHSLSQLPTRLQNE